MRHLAAGPIPRLGSWAAPEEASHLGEASLVQSPWSSSCHFLRRGGAAPRPRSPPKKRLLTITVAVVGGPIFSVVTFGTATFAVSVRGGGVQGRISQAAPKVKTAALIELPADLRQPAPQRVSVVASSPVSVRARRPMLHTHQPRLKQRGGATPPDGIEVENCPAATGRLADTTTHTAEMHDSGRNQRGRGKISAVHRRLHRARTSTEACLSERAQNVGPVDSGEKKHRRHVHGMGGVERGCFDMVSGSQAECIHSAWVQNGQDPVRVSDASQRRRRSAQRC